MCCREGVGSGLGGRGAVGFDDLALEGVVDDGAFDLRGAAFVVFGGEVKGGAVDFALERIAAEFAGEFVALLSEVEAEVSVGAVVVDAGGPVAGEGGLGVCGLGQGGGGESEEEGGEELALHGVS